MSGGLRHLTLDELFFCYKPQQITGSKCFYNFFIRKAALKLVTDVSLTPIVIGRAITFLFNARIGCVDPTNWIA